MGAKDACNDLTCLVMEAQANLRLNQPPVALRYHRNINPDVVERAIDLERAGTGHPSWFNEDLLEKWGLMRGYTQDVAKDTAPMGCVANYVKGRFVTNTGLIEAGGFVFPKLLEKVLTNGNDLMFGIPAPTQVEIKDIHEMTSSDEILEAIFQCALEDAKMQLVTYNIGKQMSADSNPDPVNSFLLDESLDEGLEAQRINAMRDGWPSFITLGKQNLADSLGAIQKLIYDEKKYTIDQLVTALQANWMGHEEMHQDFLHVPKYGNDDDVADEWMRKVDQGLEQLLNTLRDSWGFTCTVDSSVVIIYQMAGLACAASPDGRRATEHLADGTMSPMAGADRKGPTAVLNSASKLPYSHPQLFNQRFQPMWLEKENKALFAAYLREWYDKGTIPHIQFNVVDGTLLRDAQEHPESYPDLQVRVAGYSAFFVDLPKETQDSIVARTEQALC